jgi:hypothetical protein
MQKYPKGIPEHVDKNELATELYYWENERKVPIGGSQDAWGSVYPGVSLLHYDFRHHNGVLPKKVTSIVSQRVAKWFERHFWIVDCVGPRPDGYNPFDGGRFATKQIVSQLGKSGQDCFAAIKNREVEALGASFNHRGAGDAETALLPTQVRGRHALRLWRRVSLRGVLGARRRGISSEGQPDVGEKHAERKLLCRRHGGRRGDSSLAFEQQRQAEAFSEVVWGSVVD